ncbi:TetR/AcrR family transcriptional regulator [Actinomadura sp. 6N118]|uniref:TetR/AcrR family transcriptional regulator n=1 Tax=Actinomadura sp. 6N118 TaxID=3375151 RepID=UPI00379A3AC7
MAAAVRERGYFDTKIADVVRHARTSRRTFYEYFPNKEACFLALHSELNAELALAIAAAVDPHADLSVQIRQAMATWLTRIEADPAIELSWIRAVPRLGTDGVRVQRELLERFVALIRALTDTADLRAAGVKPASRHTAIMLLGGLNELVAVTLEDGGDIRGITDAAIDCTLAILGPRG